MNHILINVFKKEHYNEDNEDKFQESDINVLHNHVNPIFNDYRSKLNLSSSSSENIKKDIFIFDKDKGQITIDVEESKNLLDNFVSIVEKNKDNINLMVEEISIGIEAGLLYKTIITSLDSTLKEEHVKSLNSSDKKELLESIARNKAVFNKSGGVFITIILFTIIQSIRSAHPISMKVGLSSPSNTGGEHIEKSLLFSILNKNKLSKYIKYIIVLIIFLIFSYVMLFKMSFFKLKLIKLFLIIGISLLVVYYLKLVSILVNNLNKKDKDTNIPRYYPSKLKNQIQFLINIDDINKSKAYIQIYLISAIHMFYLLISMLIINITLMDFIKII